MVVTTRPGQTKISLIPAEQSWISAKRHEITFTHSFRRSERKLEFSFIGWKFNY